MKTILTAFFALSLLGSLAGQASAAVSANARSSSATVNVASAEFDYPDFGSQGWWQLQEDQG